jgi:hypothetical protein
MKPAEISCAADLARVPRERKVHQGGVSIGRAPRVYQQYGGVAGEIARDDLLAVDRACS